VTVYIDTSVLIAWFVADDALAGVASGLRISDDDVLVVSSFAAAEFAAIVARLHRTKAIEHSEAYQILEAFDTWRTTLAEPAETRESDIRQADGFIRALSMNVRAPDAINLAIAKRIGAAVATFDKGLAANATALGIDVLTA
jgi:predicted nucleic acid-binding protein